MAGGKVITGAFLAGASETEIRKPKKPYCYHTRYEVHADSRSVTCQDCTETLDAFDVLLGYAKGERTWKHWDEESGKKRKEVHESEQALKRIKAQTKAHSRKDAAQAVRDDRKQLAERLNGAAFKCRQIGELAGSIHRLISKLDADRLANRPILPMKDQPHA